MLLGVLRHVTGASGPGTASFADVPPGAWFAPNVETGGREGPVRGTSATTSSPAEYVTREQMAVLLARALGLVAGEDAGASLPLRDADRVSG